MRVIRIDEEFEAIVDTGGFADKTLLSTKIVNIATGAEVANDSGRGIDQVIKPIEDHTATTDGEASAGSRTITLASGNTLEKGDVFISNDIGYRVVSATDTSVTIDKDLLVSIADATDLVNTGKLTTYEVGCKIAEAGIFDVIISHPEMNDTVLKYEVVEKTNRDLISELGAGSRKMVAVA